MLEQFTFYIRHSLNDLKVNKQRTLFALLCIGVGVAAIVSLQTLAVMIDNTLTGNLQEQNAGDIQAELNISYLNYSRNDWDAPPDDAPEEWRQQYQESLDEVNRLYDERNTVSSRAAEQGYIKEFGDDSSFMGSSVALTYQGYEAVRDYLKANYDGEIDVTYRTLLANLGEVMLGMGTGVNFTTSTGQTGANFIPVIVDANVYPFYDQITLEDGRSLEQVFSSNTTGLPGLVMSRDGAESVNLSVGDTLFLEGGTSEFVLLGIVPTDTEIRGLIDGMQFGLYGYYYYLQYDDIQYLADSIDKIDTLYIKLDDPSRINEVIELINAEFPIFNYTTTQDILEVNEIIADSLDTVVTVLGMLGLLLGCMGIINTMQVIVRRRTMEIAVLKTLGLQGHQVTLLFLTQAFIMGVLGSIIGIALGWLMVFVLRSSVEGMLHQNLGFMIAPTAVVNGFIVGTLVTTVFGFLPTLNAGQVRPGIVLRPDDVVLPRSGVIASLVTLVLMICVISLIAQTILKTELLNAFLIVGGAFVAAGLIFMILWVLIWFVGRFMPSFGIIDIKLAKRQLRANKWRGAVTLLALVVAVFSLSTMTLFADSFTNMLNSLLNAENNEPVIVQAMLPISNSSVARVLRENEYVQSYTETHMFYNISFEELIRVDGTKSTRDELVQSNDGYIDSGGMFYSAQAISTASTRKTAMLDGISIQEVTDPSIIPVMIAENDLSKQGRMNVGDKLVYTINDQSVELTIVGIFQVEANAMMMQMMDSSVYIALEPLQELGITSDNVMFTAMIDKADVSKVRQEVSQILGVFVFDTRNIEQLVNKLVAQFRAFPSVVAILGLIVGGVVIANSVALATMERRKEIAVMKSVGLQRERVLSMLLLENALLGFVGGLLGVGSGLVILVILAPMVSLPLNVIPYGMAFLLMSVCVIVAVLAALTTAWNASSEKPLNVLRYE
jgi:putative ABC transport system permease protein